MAALRGESHKNQEQHSWISFWIKGRLSWSQSSESDEQSGSGFPRICNRKRAERGIPLKTNTANPFQCGLIDILLHSTLANQISPPSLEPILEVWNIWRDDVLQRLYKLSLTLVVSRETKPLVFALLQTWNSCLPQLPTVAAVVCEPDTENGPAWSGWT